MIPLPLHPRYKGRLEMHDTRLAFWFEPDKPATIGSDEEDTSREILRLMVEHLRERGMEVEQDPWTKKRFSVLREWHWLARKGDLVALVEAGGRTGNVTFYQERYFENKLGARWDIYKARLMPTELRRLSALGITSMARMLMPLGFSLGKALSEQPGPLPLRVLRVMAGAEPPDLSPLGRFNRKWDASRFRRDELGYPVAGEFQAACDAMGRPLRNGEIRYARRAGRLVRGIVVTDMNSRWSLTLPDGETLYLDSHELLSYDRPDLEPRRAFPRLEAQLATRIEQAVKRKAWDEVARFTRAMQVQQKTQELAQALRSQGG